MYKSPILIVEQDISHEFENGVHKVVLKAGFNIDKEELAKALRYDRGQYDKGYADGKANAECAYWKDDAGDTVCSHCGWRIDDPYYLGNGVACPNCGSKMKNRWYDND